MIGSARQSDLPFIRVNGALPATDPVDRKPRMLVLAGSVNQDIWSLRNLGFNPDFMSTATLNTAATDPLANYDSSGTPGATPARH